MDKQYLVLGIHNHQPIGNFDFVFEECCQKAYLPFLEVLKSHPRIKVSLHYSGILWDWFLEKSSPILDLLTEMVGRGQVELLSGGYYEPILAILPDIDKRGQIQKLNQFLIDHFHVHPRGMWLAERVWEPHLVRYIGAANIEYLALDDLHFQSAGLREADLHGYYLTEEQGVLLKVFPGSKYLRYSIPFKDPKETIDYLLREKRERGNLTLMADDGEKFGVWPGTYDLSYRQGWVDQFFTFIEKKQDELEIVTFSEYLDRFPPLGKIYLPTASYSEMEEWALPSQSIGRFIAFKKTINTSKEFTEEKPFIKGGYWRNFLSKYSESNHIYKKMLWISRQIENGQNGTGEPSVSQEWLKNAREELWRGQCNDAYWHGLFGGLYLPHLRHGVYTHLIKAENILDRHLHPSGSWIDCQQEDLDGDGAKEVIVKTPTLNCCIDSHTGGTITELDYRPKSFNLINSLMRREESYHQRLRQDVTATGPVKEPAVKSIHDILVSKEKDLSILLYYDQYARNCLIDHFLASSATLLEFSRLQHREYGDFVHGQYQKHIQATPEAVQVSLSRDGFLTIRGNRIPFRLEKIVKIPADGSELAFQYKIVNFGSLSVRCKFGIEFNINLLGGRCEDRYYRIANTVLKDRQLASQGVVADVEQAQLVDEAVGLTVSFHFPHHATLWRFPIETASNSESGFERVYQSSVIFPHWDIRLDPGGIWSDTFSLRIASE